MRLKTLKEAQEQSKIFKGKRIYFNNLILIYNGTYIEVSVKEV